MEYAKTGDDALNVGTPAIRKISMMKKSVDLRLAL
jgi:hypothetical protein